jgi:hypothetical protein
VRERGEISRDSVREAFSSGIQQDYDSSARTERIDGREEGLRADDHASSPTVGVVIHGPMAPQPMLAQVVDRDFDQPTLNGTTDHACSQGSVEQFGEERDDVDPHRGQRSSSDA